MKRTSIQNRVYHATQQDKMMHFTVLKQSEIGESVFDRSTDYADRNGSKLRIVEKIYKYIFNRSPDRKKGLCLKKFCRFGLVPLVYASAYIKLLVDSSSPDFEEFVELFLTCIIIATKYTTDYNSYSWTLIDGFDIHISKIHYLEAMILHKIKFEVDIPLEHIKLDLELHTGSDQLFSFSDYEYFV